MRPDLPVLLIGLLIAAYWLRVLKMALKARRRTGRAAHLFPPEKLGRVLRVAWYPAVVVWIAHPIASGLGTRGGWLLRPAYTFSLVRWIAFAVAAGAFGATLVCWRRMGKSWRMGIDPAEITQLVVNGPWAYVRHPIYALSSLLMWATFVALPTPLMAVVALVHLSLLQWEARREESHLLRTQGEAYAAYRRHVGRFVPRSWVPYRATQDVH